MRYWEVDRENSVEKRTGFRDYKPRETSKKTASAVTSGGSVGPFLRKFYQHQVIVSAPVQRFFMFLVLAAVIYAFVLGDGGAIRIAMLRHERASLDRNIAELRHNAALLQTEIARLDSDPFYVEKTARERYGYILPGDRVYKLVPTDGGAKSN
jgi:cell division protein FtsB